MNPFICYLTYRTVMRQAVCFRVKHTNTHTHTHHTFEIHIMNGIQMNDMMLSLSIKLHFPLLLARLVSIMCIYSVFRFRGKGGSLTVWSSCESFGSDLVNSVIFSLF